MNIGLKIGKKQYCMVTDIRIFKEEDKNTFNKSMSDKCGNH